MLMLFSSIVFLYYFLPITMLVYWSLPYKYKNIFCFLASLFFYAWGEPVYVFLMIFSIYINYILGLRLGVVEEEKRKTLVKIAIIFNMGLLVIFKYTGFILSNLWTLLGLDLAVPRIKLPLGISFFTFQALSYVIDVYRRDAQVQESFMKLGLYISAFPQLVAGPIVRYNTVMDQIENRTISLDKIAYGIIRFVIGLGKKVLLANSFALIADTIFVAGKTPDSVLSAWIGIIAYSLQIYYDFSGYSDMAIGLGSMLAFKFEENFNYPYISKSITEFWRRWHISLGTWFRDYLYIPLGGSRSGPIKTTRNLFIVWLATGLWHGAQWTFLAWGLYYFLLLILEKNILKKLTIPNIVKHTTTIILVMIGWVIFRSNSLSQAKDYILTMFALKSGRLHINNYIILHDNYYVFLAGILGASPLLANTSKKIASKLDDRVFLVISSVFLCLILFLCTMNLINSTYNPFIYFRF